MEKSNVNVDCNIRNPNDPLLNLQKHRFTESVWPFMEFVMSFYVLTITARSDSDVSPLTSPTERGFVAFPKIFNARVLVML